MTAPDWHIYTSGPSPYLERSEGERQRVEDWLDDGPPWRHPGPGWRDRDAALGDPAPREGDPKAARYVFPGDEDALHRVNMALWLRRPLLVRGAPGIGKSSLAAHIGWRLGLGVPLRWEINSRTTLQDGLYRYDAVQHLRASQDPEDRDDSIGRFIQLGPLGTALVPWKRPRVLLIDELDKASYDLPNDLLHAFEEGGFPVPELGREETPAERLVRVYDWSRQPAEAREVALPEARVQVLHHPVVVITTNDEREFPEAFRRRCVPLDLRRPDPARLAEILKTWLPEESAQRDLDALVRDWDARDQPSTDVLLQALFLEHRGAQPGQIASGLVREPDER